MRGIPSTAALFCAVLILGLSGCASPYDSSGLTGGYIEQQLEPGIWRVRFGGNGFTTPETVQTFWLYRCAELARQQGYDGFEILSNIQLTSFDVRGFDNHVYYDRGADTAHLILTHGGGGGGAFIFIAPSSPKPWIEGDIRLLRAPFAVNVPKVFDAGALIAALQPLVKGKLCDSGNVCPHVHHYLMPPSPSATVPSLPLATASPPQTQTQPTPNVVAVPAAPTAVPAPAASASVSTTSTSAPNVRATAASDTPLHLDHRYPNYQPAYPDAAQANGEQGSVVLDVQVTSSGKVRNVKIDQSSGFDDLDNAAIAGVLRWRFIPSPDGTDWTKVTVAYRLPTAIIVPPNGAQPPAASPH